MESGKKYQPAGNWSYIERHGKYYFIGADGDRSGILNSEGFFTLAVSRIYRIFYTMIRQKRFKESLGDEYCVVSSSVWRTLLK